ncbi:MAG: ferredoxin [Candidatus Dadabacteria bacterium]|nr:MAG: ferredoxin [Candidatus Dadabacteria bacterium]
MKRLIVDPDACEGHGKCVEVAPDMFYLPDDEDLVQILVPEPQTEEQIARAEAAIAACPRYALRWADESLG